MIKRIVCLLLVVCLFAAMLPAAYASDRAQLRSELDALCEKYVGTCWYGSYAGATQCKGFADMIYNELFGTGSIGSYVNGEYYYINNPRSSTEIGVLTGYASDDTAQMYNLFSQALPGDYIQMARRGAGYGHSMIVYSVESDEETGGLWIFDCNMSYTYCLVQKYFLSWERLAGLSSGISLYRHANYPDCSHNLTVVSRVEPTTTADGCLITQCSICGNTFESVLLSQASKLMASYADVDKTAWYYSYLYEAVSLGLLNGVSETQMQPNGTLTRAMSVTLLWRISQMPVGSAHTFTDVPNDRWYSGAVTWAASAKIVNGVTEDKFQPEEPVKREQIAVMLYRCAAQLGMPTTYKADLSGYTDASQISPYAYDAMCWAVASGLLNGRTETTLAPQDSATRAEAVKLMLIFNALLTAQKENIYIQ